MAREQSLARAGLLERPALAYIVPFGERDLEITRDDLDRDIVWTAERFRALGLKAGHQALITMSGFEGAWFQPIIGALKSIGVTYGIAEAMGWDNVRTSVFHRDLDLYAVLGLSVETLEGLSGRTMLGEMFGATPVVSARPQAAVRLRAAGVPAGVLGRLGPALAIECLERDGAHVNPAEWRVEERDGRLVVAPAGERAPGFGEVVHDEPGRLLTGLCGCGSDDPRVLFD